MSRRWPPAMPGRIFDEPAQQQRFFYLFLFQVPGVGEALLNAELIDYLWRTWSPGLDVPDHVEAMYADPAIRATAPKLYRADFDRSLHGLALADLAGLSEKPAEVPVPVLAGADDGCVTPDDYADAATGLAPCSRVEIVAGTS